MGLDWEYGSSRNYYWDPAFDYMFDMNLSILDSTCVEDWLFFWREHCVRFFWGD
jgi:hypothetical protein